MYSSGQHGTFNVEVMRNEEVHMEDDNINKEDKASYTTNNAKNSLKSSDYLSKNMENLLYLVTKFRIISAIFLNLL